MREAHGLAIGEIGCGPFRRQALSECLCGFAVAGDAEGAQVFEVTLAATLGNGNDVVRIPERAAAGDGAHPVEAQACGASGSAGALERGKDAHGIGGARGADSFVAREDAQFEKRLAAYVVLKPTSKTTTATLIIAQSYIPPPMTFHRWFGSGTFARPPSTNSSKSSIH